MSRMAEVQALRSELMELKQKLQQEQARYMEGATNRVEYQKRLALMTQRIQKRSVDVALAEEITAVSLASENAAKAKQDDLPEPNNKERPPNPTAGTTKSAEEAINLYKSQIEIVQGDVEYREKLADVETAMASILHDGINEILEILRDSCNDEQLVEAMERVANGESEAPPSPDKKPKPKVKSVRVLGPEHPLGHDINSTDGGEVHELEEDQELDEGADPEDEHAEEIHPETTTEKKKGWFGRKQKGDPEPEEFDEDVEFDDDELQSEEPTKPKKKGWFGRKQQQDPEPEEFDEDVEFDEHEIESEEPTKAKKKGWFGRKQQQDPEPEEFDEDVEPPADDAGPEKKEKKGWFGRKK